MPDQTPNTSPVLDAFRRGIKEKRGNVDMLENNGACKSLGSVYPRVVVRKLLVNSGSPKCLLAKNDKAIKTDQGKNEKYLGVTRTPLSCGNCWEQETDFMDLEETSSDSNKWISLPQADAQKACAQNNDNTLLCQNLGLPTNLPCTSPDSTLRLALGTLHRERKRKKRRVKRSKAQPVMLISGTSVSHQVCLKTLLRLDSSDHCACLLCLSFFFLTSSEILGAASLSCNKIHALLLFFKSVLMLG